MQTLKITNGDIAVRGDGETMKLTGAERIRQELALWILEPINTDLMYPGFGSIIGRYVGSPATEEALAEIRAEVVRIVDNYIAYQNQQMEEYRGRDAQTMLNAWKDEDVIASVDLIDVSAVADTCKVSVQLTTVGGSAVNITEQLI